MTTAQQQNWLTACHQSDLVAHSGVAVLLDQRQIALFYLPENDTVYAIDNHCPFSQANVIARGILGDLQGKIVVASPLYKQHFCLQSGQCLEDDSVTLTTYAARIDADGQIQIALQAPA